MGSARRDVDNVESGRGGLAESPRGSDILARWLVVYFNPRVYAILSNKYGDVGGLFHRHFSILHSHIRTLCM